MGITAKADTPPTAFAALSFACMCYIASKLLGLVGLHALSPIAGYPTLNTLCQSAVSAAAVVGLACGLGHDVSRPLTAYPAVLQQLMHLALVRHMGVSWSSIDAREPVVAMGAGAAGLLQFAQPLDGALAKPTGTRFQQAQRDQEVPWSSDAEVEREAAGIETAACAAARRGVGAATRCSTGAPPLASVSMAEGAGLRAGAALSQLLSGQPARAAMRRVASLPALFGAGKRGLGDGARGSGGAQPSASQASADGLETLRAALGRKNDEDEEVSSSGAGAAVRGAMAVPSPGTATVATSNPSALGSLGLDAGCPASVRQVVTDDHLLQFGALLGEADCAAALGGAGSGGSDSLLSPATMASPPRIASLAACTGPDSLLGVAEDLTLGNATTNGEAANEWEPIVDERREGLEYAAWRAPLRRGLYVYRTRAVLAGVDPAHVRAFHLDDAARRGWDDAAAAIAVVGEDGSRTELGAGAEPVNGSAVHGAVIASGIENGASTSPASCLQVYRAAFPRPMAAREYHYARRVWHRPSDGGCYAVCRGADLPDTTAPARGAVRVADYISCVAIRGHPEGTELLTAYFEDSGVRPGLVKAFVPKSLWGLVQKYETALRAYDYKSAPLVDAAAAPVHGSGLQNEEEAAAALAANQTAVTSSSTCEEVAQARGASLQVAHPIRPPSRRRWPVSPAAAGTDALLGGFAMAASGAACRVRRAALCSSVSEGALGLEFPSAGARVGSSWGAERRMAAAAGAIRSGALSRPRPKHGTTWVKRIVIAAGISILHASLPSRGL